MYNLNDDNFYLYAANHYDENILNRDEFEEEIARIRFIRKIFSKYKNSDQINERLVLNHLIVLYNCFDNDAMTRMLFYMLSDMLDCLKPFLQYLSYWPDFIYVNDDFVVIGKDVKSDYQIEEQLKGI